MVKIRVSYDHPEELAAVLRLLGNAVISCRPAKDQGGPHRRAYIMLNPILDAGLPS